ncbi:6-bladed beta-propeller [Algoriphagus vanfongensis]|uniref:6-bladed beta-propeller n=1 Tax=Algoriphagus vanfongensis TaxID=426371 RepID=UPI000413577A|nr:6-bladed beta-propeller [Algoriphagus vanfongensis]
MKKIFVLPFLSLFACSTAIENQVSKTYAIEEIPISSEKLQIEKVILLEGSGEEFLGAELKTLLTPEGIFVSNYDRPAFIHHFDRKGTYLGPIVKVGDGPGQVKRFEEFRVSGDSLLVNVGMGDHEELVYFSISGHEQLKKVETEASGFSFYPNSDGTFWFYSGLNRAVGDYRLQRLDAEGKISQKWMYNDFSESLIPFMEKSIFEGDERLLVRDPLFPIVNQIGTDTLELAYQFDFGSYSLPAEIWEIEDPMQWFERINSNGFGDLNKLFENEDFFVGDFVFQRDRERSRKLLVINRRTEDARIYEVDEEKEPHYYSPIALEGDHLLFIAYAPALIEVLEELPASDEVKAQLKELKEESNPVIIYASLEK